MPKAKGRLEAIFAILVVVEGKDSFKIVYRTWELTTNAEEDKKVALYGSWTADRTHLNFGYSSDLSKREFLNRLKMEFIDERVEIRAASKLE